MSEQEKSPGERLWARGSTLDETWDQLTDDRRKGWENLADAVATPLLARIAELEKALVRIANWHGEFPRTGRVWDPKFPVEGKNEMSYSACYGSNGERDFMRQLAATALHPDEQPPESESGT